LRGRAPEIKSETTEQAKKKKDFGRKVRGTPDRGAQDGKTGMALSGVKKGAIAFLRLADKSEEFKASG